MSAKRFQLDIGDDYCFINDGIEDKTYAIYNDRFKESWSQEIVDLLNEQQATIQSLKEENDNCRNDYRELFSNYVALEEKNEQLRKELKELNRKYIAFSEATDKRLKEMMR